MAVFRVVRTTPLSVDQAWRRLTDWPGHAAHVPLTRISVLTPEASGEGTCFVARTGLGPLAVDDPMEVVRWEVPGPGRPGRCRLEKRGRTIMGWAEIEVRERPLGTRVTWVEELRVRRLPRALDLVLARAGRRVFGRAVDGLLSTGAGPRSAYRHGSG
ncbi:SRPBCC family protein [Streptomyces sp. NPDC057445]|uniref:SRPBCC family protein n=1 Tax=Streptomyces sp. NPDC057445 TaxID=3346136 RepID=UPI0036AC149A